MVFQLLTLSGWGEIMQDCIDSDSPTKGAFMMAFIMLAPLFSLKAFLAIFINKLNILKDQQSDDKARTMLLHWKNNKGTSKPFRTWQVMTKIETTRVHHNMLRMLEENQEGAIMCIRACGRMKNEILALAFARWYQVTVLTVVLEKFTDQLLERDEHRKDNSLSSLAKIRNRCKVLANSKLMEYSMIGAILLGTLLMLAEHSYTSLVGRMWADVSSYNGFHAFLALGQIGCAMLFTVELILKLVGQGLITYFRDILNWIDFTVAVSSIVDVANLVVVYRCLSKEDTNPYACEGASLVVQLLRAMRLIRLAKLIRFFPNLRRQLMLLVKMLGACASTILFLIIFMFTFSVLGMVFLGGQLFTPVSHQYDIYLGALIYFRWSPNPSSYFQSNLLRPTLPGHPAYVINIDVVNYPDAPFLVQPLYGAELAHILREDPPKQGTLFLMDVSLFKSKKKEEVEAGGDPTQAAADACLADGLSKVGSRCKWVLWTTLGEQSTEATITYKSIRSNFNSFPMAGLTVLQLLSKAGWPEVMAVARTRFGGIILAYMYPLIFIGELIVLNMTTAVVIVCFSNRSQAQSSEESRALRDPRFGLDPQKTRDKVITAVRSQTRQILIANTADLNWRVRCNAVQVYCMRMHSRTRTNKIQTQTQPCWFMRMNMRMHAQAHTHTHKMQALSAVGDKGDEAIIEVLTLKVGDLHTAVRVHAIEILGIMCPSTFSDSFPDVAVSVRKALRDDSRFVREMAATTLAIVSTPGDPGSIQDLVRASSDPEPIVRKAAIVSLGMLAWVNDQYVIKALTGRIHAAADETAEVLEAVHTAVTVLQDNTGKLLQQLKEDATEKNKEQQGTGNASHAKGLDDEYRKVSILGKLERKQQASLVASIKSADKVCTSDTVAF